MKITSVNVHKTEKENSRMKGIASVVIDNCFAVRDIRIIQGDDKYHDIAHPIDQATRDMFEKAILDAYNEAE